MINNPVIFYIASFILIFFAIISLFNKNIIYSLLSAIIVFFAGAIFFFILGSEYNAIIQAAVYGLAVPIIIGISIMFTNNRTKDSAKNSDTPSVILLFSGIFIMAFIYLVMMSTVMLPDTFHMVGPLQTNHYDVISSFAKNIFINYVWAFELLSLLLTIVIAGLTIFRKRGAR